MIVALIFNIIAIFFAYLESAKIYKHGLKLSLITVFIFLAFRYDYGNDYMGYLDYFLKTNTYSFFDLKSLSIKGNEYGWLYLNRIFGPIGFFVMTAMLAAFTCYVLFRFIKKFVPSQYYWYAVLWYVFEPNAMLILSSAMRQAVGVILFLISIDYIIQKKVIKYLLLISIAALFHSSAVFLYPVILLSFVNWRIKLIHIGIVFAVYTISIIYVKELYEFINLFTTLYFEDYSMYTQKAILETNFSIGLALTFLIFTILMYLSNKETNTGNRLIFKFGIIVLLMIPLSFGIQLITRLNYYFWPVMMAVFPLAFTKIKKAEFRLLFISIVVIYSLYHFFMFFQSEYNEFFGEYHTIFSSPSYY